MPPLRFAPRHDDDCDYRLIFAATYAGLMPLRFACYGHTYRRFRRCFAASHCCYADDIAATLLSMLRR